MNAVTQLLLDERISGRTPNAFKVPESLTVSVQTDSAPHPAESSILTMDCHASEVIDARSAFRRAA